MFLASAAAAFEVEALVEQYRREPEEVIRKLAFEFVCIRGLKSEIRALQRDVMRLEDRKPPRA